MKGCARKRSRSAASGKSESRSTVDAYDIDGQARKSVVFVSAIQAQHYGGYLNVAKSLKPDVIKSPIFMDEYWDGFRQFHEVGHA